jgi:DNA-binding transcriptional MerR regulator
VVRIGELADRIGVTTDTIRFYEKSGLLPRPSRQRDNNYREYSEAEVDHLRLLIDLRRLDLPLDDAARIASWCHSGHCADTTAELPSLIADRRAAIAARIEGLRALDSRLADLDRHLAGRRASRLLSVVGGDGAACCDAASAVSDIAESGCSCCTPPRPS